MRLARDKLFKFSQVPKNVHGQRSICSISKDRKVGRLVEVLVCPGFCALPSETCPFVKVRRIAVMAAKGVISQPDINRREQTLTSVR